MDLPPPLVADDLDRQRAARVLGESTANGEVEDDEEEQHERGHANEYADDLRVAAMLLVRHYDDRLEVLARRTPAGERGPERGDDDGEPHGRRDDQRHPEEPVDDAIAGSGGIEHILRALTRAGACQQRSVRNRDAEGTR